MKNLVTTACLLLSLTLTASAQKPGGGRVTPSRPRIDIPDPNASQLIFISGKVVTDDGSAPADSVAVQTVCRGVRRTETHTDSKGHFSFQFGGRSAASNPEYEVDTPSTSVLPGRRGNDSRNLQECELQASLAGFTSGVVQLGARFSGSESADIGQIVLRRMGNVDGFTISVTTAQAPEAARKALEKGQEQMKKEKWDDAQKSLEKAVGIYPKFAVAWFRLGQAQLHKNDIASARASFLQSVAADDKYINPYHSLSQLALRDQNWQELVQLSDKLLSLNSVSFPEFWLWNSLGNYCMKNIVVAEKSARRGLELDPDHHIPRLEYVMGMVLLKKPDYQQAAQHLRTFLSLTRQPTEIAETQKQLAEIARLSPTSNSTVSEKQ